MKIICKNAKFAFATLVIGLILISCEPKFVDEFPTDTAVQDVKFELRGDYLVEPNLLVINLYTEKGEVKNARTYLTKDANGNYLTENFPLKDGDYAARSWIAYDTISNNSLARSAVAQVPFAVVQGANTILPVGSNVLLEGEEIPFNQFSFLAAGDRFPRFIIPLKEGGLLGMTEFGPRNSYDMNFFRMTTKGDVAWRTFVDHDKGFVSRKAIQLAGEEVLSSTYLHYNVNWINFPPRIMNPRLSNIMDPISGMEDLIVSADFHFGQLADFDSDFQIYALLDIEATPDGGYLSIDKLLRPAPSVYYLTHRNADGSAKWSQILDIGSERMQTFLNSGKNVIGVQDDGRFMVLSYINGGAPVIRHFNADGTLINRIEYMQDEMKTHSSSVKFLAMSDGGYLIAAVHPDTALRTLTKLDSEGAVLWTTTIDHHPIYVYNSTNGSAFLINNGYGNTIIATEGYNIGSDPSTEFEYRAKFFRFDSETGALLQETTNLIGGPGKPGISLNFLRSLFETNDDDIRKRGIVGMGEFINEGASSSTPWFFKFPSETFEPQDNINDPTIIVYPN